MGRLQFSTGQFSLPSGLRVGVETAPERGMVSVAVTVGVGAGHDPAAQLGMAHFVEHLMFRSRLPGGWTTDTAFTELGATGVNAFTSPDDTTYVAHVPRDNLPRLLSLFAHMLSVPLEGVTEDEASIEREIIKNEVWQRDETGVAGQLRGWIHAALFTEFHPYGRPVGGTTQTINTLLLSDARAFAQHFYRPDNISITLVGDVTTSDVRNIIQSKFPPAFIAPPSVALEPLPTIPPLPGALAPIPPQGVHTYYASVARPMVVITWRLPSTFDPGGHVTRILSAPAPLAAMENSLETHDAVHSASAWATHYRNGTILVVAAELDKPEQWRDVSDRARRFFAWWWGPLDAGTVNTAYQQGGDALVSYLANSNDNFLHGVRQQTSAEVLFSAESPAARLLDQAAMLHHGGGIERYGRDLMMVKDTHFRDIAAIAPLHLSEHNARVLFLYALPAEQTPDPGQTGARRESALQSVANAPEAVATRLNPPRAAPPEGLSSMRSFVLPNGLSVALIQRTAFPTITAALAFKGGTLATTPQEALTVVRIIEKNQTISDPNNGLTLRGFDTPDMSGDFVQAGRGNLPQALTLLARRIVSSEKEINWEYVLGSLRRQLATGNDGRSAKSPESRAQKRLNRALFGDTPLGQSIELGRLDALKGSQLTELLQSMRQPANAMLVVAGDLKLDDSEKWVHALFEPWRTNTSYVGRSRPPTIVPPLPGPPRTAIIVEHQATHPQVALTLACRLPQADAQTAAVHRLLANLISAWLSTRIRHEAGIAYSVGGAVAVYRGGAAHLVIDANIDNRHVEHAMRILVGHWSRFSAGDFDPGAISQVQWGLVTGSNLDHLTSGRMVFSVMDAMNKGWNLNEHQRQIDRITKVNPSELREAFAVCRNTTVVSLVGNRDVIDPALKAVPWPNAVQAP
jgi:zinc protease